MHGKANAVTTMICQPRGISFWTVCQSPTGSLANDEPARREVMRRSKVSFRMPIHYGRYWEEVGRFVTVSQVQHLTSEGLAEEVFITAQMLQAGFREKREK